MIRISEDGQQAFMTIHRPQDGLPYLAEELLEVIKANEVTYGLKIDVINQMASEMIYERETLIAEGIPVVDGIDGYFEYFLGESNGKPIILADGTVDYSSVNFVGTVSEGDRIATYHPSVPGHFGYSVKGEVLKPRVGQGYHVANMIGCRYEEESKSYFAETSGRVEVSPNKIEVLGELLLKRNINNVYGNVDFIGDVVIRGDVNGAVAIKASGSITVEGTVQGGSLYAGENLEVTEGILGGNTTVMVCGGNMKARFIEYADITAYGNLEAGYVLDCTVKCGGTVKVQENQASVTAGNTYAAYCIDAKYLGNKQNVQTVLAVGLTGREEDEMHQCLVKKYELDKQLTLISSREISIKKGKGSEEEFTYAIQSLRREKLHVLVQLKHLERKMEVLEALLSDNREEATIKGSMVFAGVDVTVDGRQAVIENAKGQTVFH